MTNPRTTSLILACLLISTLAGSAHGYIDGGTGSMLLQAALAGLLGAAFVCKSFWSSLRGMFRKGENGQDRSE